METITKIRRLRLVKGQSISAIARDLNLSRNTVKKYLNTTDLPSYQRQRQPRPQLGQWQQRLSDYAAERNRLRQSGLNDSQLQAAIAELQASRFDERERLRVQALDPEL